MKLNIKSIYRENTAVCKSLLVFIGIVLACRVTGGAALAFVGLYGAISFTKNKPGATMLCYMLMPMLLMVNNTLRGFTSLFGMLCRICPIVLSVFVLLGCSRRQGRQGLPVGMLYLYLVVALVSSMNGWCPEISYLKIVNFMIFLIGMHLGLRNIHHSEKELMILRNGILAFSIFIIIGSVAVIPFPSIGYSFFVESQRRWTYIDDAAAFIANTTGIKLFSGVTNQSQALAQLAVACTAYTFMDMLFVERKLNTLHMLVIICAPIVLYMSRSRMALVGFGFTLFVIYMYAIPNAKISTKVKSSIRNMMTGFLLLAAVGMVVVEIRDQSISKWLRKTEDVEQDTRDLGDALTASRMGLIEDNLADFKRSPMFGMGFQVSEHIKFAYDSGRISLFSAPIEKGVLPVMVLSETGAAGATVFIVFLIAFFGTCMSKKYTCTASLMAVLLCLNMNEATFFSPGGLGGGLWVILLGGGFTIDMIMLNRRMHGDIGGGVGMSMRPFYPPGLSRGW